MTESRSKVRIIFSNPHSVVRVDQVKMSEAFGTTEAIEWLADKRKGIQIRTCRIGAQAGDLKSLMKTVARLVSMYVFRKWENFLLNQRASTKVLESPGRPPLGCRWVHKATAYHLLGRWDDG